MVAPPVFAQRVTGWLDVGGAAVQQPRSRERNAGTVGGGIGLIRPTWSLTGDGAWSFAEDSVGAAQYALRASVSPRRARWSLTDVEVSNTTVGVSWPGHPGNRTAVLRQRLLWSGLQFVGSAGVGRTSRFGLNTRSNAFQTGVQGSRYGLTLAASWQRAYTDDFQLIEASGFALKAAADAYALNDALLDARWQWHRFNIAASQSWRSGAGNTVGTAQAHIFTGSWSATDAWQLFVYSGRQLADPLRGIPTAKVAGAAVRLMFGARTRDVQSARPKSIDAEAHIEQRDGHSTLVVRIEAPTDAIVEVASSANAWTPQRAAHNGNAHTTEVTVPSGTHRIAIRINGGAWRAPKGLVRVPDDFGGTAGIIVVP